MKISAVIPVYKNKQLFMDNLVHNYPFLKGGEIIIVDDASNENLEADIKREFRDIKVLVNKKNIGFAGTINKGVSMANNELILLLNSDVRLVKVNFSSLIEEFENDEKIFAISFLQREKDGSEVGKNILFFDRGFFRHKKSHDLKKGLTAWAEGGSAILRKKYFELLGGFDEIYSPFYWEDIDLSHKAFKRGWKILFDPSTRVEHFHESTIGKFFTSKFIKMVSYRNQFIFTWKNINELQKLLSHSFFLPYHFLSALIKGDREFFIGFIGALKLTAKFFKHEKL